jgi:hypothetical protein
MERRLTSWKKIYFVSGGCLTLIKGTLSSLPTYFWSLFPLPGEVTRRLEGLQRDFLLDGIGGEPSFLWRIVCSSVIRGGLSVKNLMLFNKVLIGKWF